MMVHLDHIQVNFEYQGHWFKVKVISWKMLILLPGHHLTLFDLSGVKVINEVKVYQQAGGGPSTERHSSFQNKSVIAGYDKVIFVYFP